MMVSVMLPLGKQDGHRPAQADYHGGRHHAGHALAELGAGLGNAHAGENHSHNSHGHVDRGDLRQPPFPPEGTHHREDNGGQEHHNDSHPAAVEVQSFLKLHGRRLLLEIILSHHAVLGGFS